MFKPDVSDKYISAANWAARWDCSTSSVRRVARRLSVRRIYVGTGHNGMVRYSLEDVMKIEAEGVVGPNEDRLGARQSRLGKRSVPIAKCA
jgi:hypothetical protein